jgi:hypothetical protein
MRVAMTVSDSLQLDCRSLLEGEIMISLIDQFY